MANPSRNYYLICVAVPVYWTISSTLLANNPQFIHAWKYEEGKTLFYFLTGSLLLRLS
ncbi:hypothetical protein RYX41_10830 [Lactiplantibacillus plantarum]|nr:hypothetical protein [Lactiplantibacillus plantarum]